VRRTWEGNRTVDNITPYSQVEAAIDAGDVGLARDLLNRHADWLKGQGWFNDLLLHAARGDKVDMVALLVEFGGDINAPQAADMPEGALVEAAREGAVNVVRWLLDRGAKVNYQVQGMTRCVALTGAVCDGHLEVVKLLVERGGADINAVWAGQNALGNAMMYGHKEIEVYLRSKGAKEPSRLAAKAPPSETDPILDHIETYLGKPNPLSLQEILPSDPPLVIHVVLKANCQILVTRGMSDRPMTVPPGGENYRFAELLIYLPRGWPLTARSLGDPNHSWPLEWLRRLAHYPHEHDSWLGGPATVIANGDPPQPLAPNTRLTCLLAITEASEFGWLTLPDGRRVAFYTLYPLYTEERDLEVDQGVVYLLRLFQKHRIGNIVDLRRPNVALPSGRRGKRRS
jgi:hypothetical protein